MPAGIPSALAERKQINGANPAANAEVSQVVPSDKWWNLLSVSVVLVQGITQTPQPILIIEDAENDVVFAAPGASAAQGASTTARYTWAPGLLVGALVGTTPNIFGFAPLPEDLIIGPGWEIKTQTLGIGAGTDYAAPSLSVVEYAS